MNTGASIIKLTTNTTGLVIANPPLTGSGLAAPLEDVLDTSSNTDSCPRLGVARVREVGRHEHRDGEGNQR